jgi:hypothetical protein
MTALASAANIRRYGLFIHQRTFRSSRCVNHGLAAGVAGRAADQVGDRRRPVFRPWAGTPVSGRRCEGWPAAAANSRNASPSPACARESRSAVTILRAFLPHHLALPPGIYTARGRTGQLAGAQFSSAAVYALPTARTIRLPDRAAAAGNDPGRLTMESSASAGRVASAVLDRRRRGR